MKENPFISENTTIEEAEKMEVTVYPKKIESVNKHSYENDYNKQCKHYNSMQHILFLVHHFIHRADIIFQD